jgi:hypothetical protein
MIRHTTGKEHDGRTFARAQVKNGARRLMTVLVAVAISGTTVAAYAICDETTASQADIDLWNTHGCWQDFFLWQYQAYNMHQSDWQPRGWFDACNQDKEYPKHWNASYLVTYGLSDNIAQAFHGTVDYRATAEGGGSNYHDSFVHQATDQTGIFGQFTGSAVQTSCALYDPSLAPNANPGSRAGDFMHEAWHAWMQKYNFNNGSAGGHRPGPQGACTISNCDYFYFHGIGAFNFGEMWQNDGTAKRFHSPNQVQVEFLCDVSDLSQTWVPATVRQAAAADANQRAAQRFINGPGYVCGSPRPW